MSEPAAFADVVLDAQRVAGMLAARRRGDHEGALALMSSFGTERSRGDAALLLAELLLGLLAHEQGRPVDDVVTELSLQLADLSE